ncbi:hypothetical protein EVG20_g9711 [Dentipellis fragilis]|uniref:Uncharacterized protein n=1 Tax=Dentipellis fragilis TaxID=205917 RepID=A0A4Y9XZ44_9AGAM|nr:hypothetical protein EVG20_g9711 [Dentipellis fragilis]
MSTLDDPSPKCDGNSSFSSASLALYPNGPWRETLRDAARRVVRELYPHIEPRDDYELSVLLDGDFEKEGIVEAFHEFIADALNSSVDLYGHMRKKEAIAKLRAEAKKEMDGPSYMTGVGIPDRLSQSSVRPQTNALRLSG